MEDFKDQVKRGFSKCRLDIDEVKDDSLILKEKISLLESDNSKLRGEVSSLSESLVELKGELKGINIALDYIKNFNEQNNNRVVQKSGAVVKEKVVQEQNIVNELVEDIRVVDEGGFSVVPERKEVLKQAPVEKKKDSYEALLAFKAKINKKELLKQKLMSMVSEAGMNLSELKFLFVDHYKYCSKATFYNYLKEIELEKLIVIKRENTKNFVYLNRGRDVNIIDDDER